MGQFSTPISAKGGSLLHADSHHEAIRKITEYIEIFYNRQRRHAKLGNISPDVFEKKFYKLKQAA